MSRVELAPCPSALDEAEDLIVIHRFKLWTLWRFDCDAVSVPFYTSRISTIWNQPPKIDANSAIAAGTMQTPKNVYILSTLTELEATVSTASIAHRDN